MANEIIQSKTDTPPVVSVCVVTYNHGNYIRQCLDGIMMQKTNFSFEVIVGDDCSTDGTRAVIQEFEKRYPSIIKPLYHKTNVGGARNAYEFCYPRLKGKYVATCEGDDYWTDADKLQRQVDFLENNPDYVIAFHRVNVVNQVSQVIKQGDPSKEIIYYKWSDIFHNHIPTLSAVFRNCLKIDHNMFLKVLSADALLFALLSRHGGAADLGFVGASYRKHAGGIFSQKSLVEQYKEGIRIRRTMHDLPYFNAEQKYEIRKEIEKRKKLYIKHFAKKKELINCFKILLS